MKDTFPPGWGHRAAGGDETPTLPSVQRRELNTTASVDENWLQELSVALAAFCGACVDRQMPLALSDWMRSWTMEYAVGGIHLDVLLRLARRAANDMPLSTTQRFTFVGIISYYAVRVEPQAQGRTKGNPPPFLIHGAVRLVEMNLHDESGEQLLKLDEAVRAAHARLANLLEPKMLPKPKTMIEWYRQLREQEPGAPMPRRGRPPGKSTG